MQSLRERVAKTAANKTAGLISSLYCARRTDDGDHWSGSRSGFWDLSYLALGKAWVCTCARAEGKSSFIRQSSKAPILLLFGFGYQLIFGLKTIHDSLPTSDKYLPYQKKRYFSWSSVVSGECTYSDVQNIMIGGHWLDSLTVGVRFPVVHKADGLAPLCLIYFK